MRIIKHAGSDGWLPDEITSVLANQLAFIDYARPWVDNILSGSVRI